MPFLDTQRFIFVTGKGGVGKTTVSVALGAHLAQQGRRVLVVVPGGSDKAARLVGLQGMTGTPTRAGLGLYVAHIEPEEAMREYGQMVLKSQALYDTLFDNRYVRGFFRGVPGLREWALLGKAWHLCGGPDPAAARPGELFDVVVLDAPATGHGTDVLRVPRIIVDIAPGGRLRADAEAAWTTLRDPRQSAVVLVALAEDLVTTETFELAEIVRDELGLPLGGMVVNLLQSPLFTPLEREALLEHGLGLERPQGVETALFYGARRAATEAVQAENLRRLEALRVPLVRFPRLHQEPRTAQDVAELAKLF